MSYLKIITMKRKHIILAMMFFVTTLFSCTENNSYLFNPIEEETVNLQIDNSLLIGHNEELTPDDARCVALRSNVYSSRANNCEVVSVVPINDENDKTIIYAVNFEQGYKLISAQKSFYPIIAEVEKGNYEEKIAIKVLSATHGSLMEWKVDYGKMNIEFLRSMEYIILNLVMKKSNGGM